MKKIDHERLDQFPLEELKAFVDAFDTILHYADRLKLTEEEIADMIRSKGLVEAEIEKKEKNEGI